MVAVLGASRATITETLWHLYRREPPFVPSRLVIFTTTIGARSLDDDFVAALAGLCREHRVPAPPLEVLIPKTVDGVAIDDTATGDQDRAMASLIYNEVRRLTRDGEPPVHASIAGGRKTMSTRMADAMSLFGRQCDEASHVLVHPREFEVTHFFYKPSPAIRIRCGDGIERSTDDARIDYIDHRFWPLRGLVDESILGNVRRAIDFDELALAIQATLDPPPLRLFDRTGEVEVGHRPGKSAKPAFLRRFRPAPKHYAMLRVLAECRRGALRDVEGAGEGHPQGWLEALDFQSNVGLDTSAADDTLFFPAAARFLEIMHELNPSQVHISRQSLFDKSTARSLRSYLNPILTGLNEDLHRGIGYRRLTDHYSVSTSRGSKEQKRSWAFGLLLDPDKIELA